MTVSATERRAGPFDGNGSATAFPFSFKVFAATDVAVMFTSATDVDSTLVLNSDYSVTLHGDQDTSPGGSITYPLTGSPLAAGEKLTILGAMPYTQPTELPDGGDYRARTVQDALDRLAILVQQIAELTGRTITVSPASGISGGLVLPNPSGGALVGWNAGGTALTNVDPNTITTTSAFADWATDVFNGDGSTTDFVIVGQPVSVDNTDSFVDGVPLTPGVDYTYDQGTKTISYVVAPSAGTNNVTVRYGQALPSVGLAEITVLGIAGGSGVIDTVQFTGGGVTLTRAGSTLNVDIPSGAGQEDIQFKNAGSSLGTAGSATSLDVTGAATLSRTGDALTLDVPAVTAQAQLQFKDEGSNLGATGTVTAVDITGSGVTASRSGNTVTLNVTGATGQAPIQFKDEGTDKGSLGAIEAINFTGAGITATASGTTLTVDVPSAGAVDASLVTSTPEGTGAVATTVADRLNGERISVKDFGALGDAVNDDTAEIQLAINYAATIGGVVYFPPGTYIITSSLTLDGTAANADFYPRVSLEGHSATTTRIVGMAGAYSMIRLLGGASGNGVHSYQQVSGLYLQKSDRLGAALEADHLAFLRCRGLVMVAAGYGAFLTDVQSALFENCHFKFNNQGLRVERVSFTYPNAISLVGCSIGANYEYGAWIVGGTTFNMFGGSCEGNGVGGVGGVAARFGILCSNAGYEGAVGVNLSGVYFEGNSGTADVWLANSVNSAAHSISGCTFNRVSNTGFTLNNIKVETANTGVKQTISVMGCGFKKFLTYTASAARRYIESVTSAGATNSVAWAGCMFGDSAEAPSITNEIAGGGSAGVASFNTRTGAVSLTSGDVTGALGFTPQVAGSYQPLGSYEPRNTEIARITDFNGVGAYTVTATLTGCPVPGASKWARFRTDSGGDVWVPVWY